MDLRDDAAFLRLVTDGLRQEWHQTIGGLPRLGRRVLKEPGFVLEDSGSRLGRWIGPPVREIRISWSLVLDHPWYAVVDVLKHEVAHQLVEEGFGERNETAHGPAFREACGYLGANPAASGTFPPLDRSVLGSAGFHDDRDRIMSKIRKLLALGSSPNENEAERAVAKAHELIAKYNLEMVSGGGERDFHSICVGEPRLRHSLDAHALGTLLRDFYFVKSVWVPMYVLARGKMGRALEISGARHNVQLAHYVHDYVNRYIDRQWALYRGRRRGGRNGRRDFALGVMTGFRGVLERQSERSQTKALIRVGDPQLEAYFAERHPRLRRSGAGRNVRVDRGTLGAGEEAGRKLVIRPGIEGGQRKRGRRLTG